MLIRAYHATTPARASSILREGFRLDAGHTHDPGDFGHAIYLTTSCARAKAIGQVLLTVEVEVRNPVDLDNHDAYALVIDTLGFDTIHGKSHPGGRAEAARKAREHFLSQGHDVLLSRRRAQGEEEIEVAVYDLASIRGVKL